MRQLLKAGWNKLGQHKNLVILLLINIVLALINSLFQQQAVPVALLYSARFVSYYLFMQLLKQRYGSRQLHRSLILSILLILVLGFIQYLIWPDLTQLFYLGFDDHFYRLTSTILDPAFTGLLLIFAILFYLAKKHLQIKDWLVVLLLVLGLALTYSRASYLSLLAALVFLAIKRPQQLKRYLISCLILVISLPLLPTASGGEGVKLARTSTIEGRLSNGQYFLDKNQGLSRWLGLGPFMPDYQSNALGLIDHSHFADSWPIFLYNSLGVFGCLLLILLIGQLLIKVKDNGCQKTSWQSALLVALLVHSLFNSDISQAFINPIFLGFIFVKSKQLRDENLLSWSIRSGCRLDRSQQNATGSRPHLNNKYFENDLHCQLKSVDR